MDIITNVLPFLVFLALLWFTYTNISLAVAMYRAKKDDSTLSSCLGLTIFYIALFVGSVALMVLALINNKLDDLYLPLNVLTIGTLAIGFLLQQIILVGHRQMMIGKIKLDYRKIKRVSYPKAKKLRFVYGQRTYETPLRFIDDFKLKKALQKAR